MSETPMLAVKGLETCYGPSQVLFGMEFSIGNGEVVKKIPAGATQLQLGVNDDIFGGEDAKTANSGSFTVQVSAAPNS